MLSQIQEKIKKLNNKIHILIEHLNNFSDFVRDNKFFCNSSDYLDEHHSNNSSEYNSQLYMIEENLYNNFKKIDFFKLISKLKKNIENNNIFLKQNNIEYDGFSESYKNYIYNRTENISSTIDTIIEQMEKRKEYENTRVFNYAVEYLYNNIYTMISDLDKSFDLQINELFEHFKYANKNYVIFGKNGSGKTTLLKKVSETIYNSNSIIIPANRIVDYTVDRKSSTVVNFNLDYNQILSHENSIFYLTRLLNEIELKHYRSAIKNDKSISQKFIDLISLLDLEREIVIESDFLNLKSQSENIYQLNSASDGERMVIYLILSILLAPTNSYVFIDEPERHLNGSLLRILFDQLEELRTDLVFIYLTHITDFVESRSNVQLIYLEKGNTFGSWIFKDIEQFEDISLDVILNIEGSKNDLIFCEGDRNSIDYKILKTLYNNMEIVPVESCEQVKMNTKAVNNQQLKFRRKAYGVIDNDYMLDSEIDSLKNDNIYAIGFNEWENFLISSFIIDYVNNSFLQKNINNIKNGIINHIKCNSYDYILSDFITKRYSKIILLNKLKYGENLENNIDTLNKSNKEKLLKEVDIMENNLKSKADYDDLIAIVPGKQFLKKVSKDLGFNTDKDYINMIVNLSNKDITFKEKLKKKLNLAID